MFESCLGQELLQRLLLVLVDEHSGVGGRFKVIVHQLHFRAPFFDQLLEVVHVSRRYRNEFVAVWGFSEIRKLD